MNVLLLVAANWALVCCFVFSLNLSRYWGDFGHEFPKHGFFLQICLPVFSMGLAATELLLGVRVEMWHDGLKNVYGIVFCIDSHLCLYVCIIFSVHIWTIYCKYGCSCDSFGRLIPHEGLLTSYLQTSTLVSHMTYSSAGIIDINTQMHTIIIVC